MKFDLTKEAVLDNKDRKTYRLLQAMVYFVAVLGALYFSYLILFPSRTFEFDFNNPNSSANSIINPRNEIGSVINDGKISKNKDMYFDATLPGNFSKATISVALNGKSNNIESGVAEIRRTYQAFSYPESGPVGFKNGTLIKSRGSYYLISGGELKKFESMAVINSFGLSPSAFIEVSADELDHNTPGPQITVLGGYPDDTLFKISGNYYIMENNKIKKFVSEKAFLTQYASDQAIEKGEDFLAKYELSENLAGYADGSLISYGDGVYVVSAGFVSPIDNPVTFESLGYNWNSVMPIDADEFSLYQKGKLLNIKAAHPDGTIFSISEDGRYYIIQNKLKHFLPSAKIAHSWMKADPILISAKALEISSSCSAEKNFFGAKTYSCKLSIENLANLPGKDYEIKQSFNQDVEIDSLGVTFKKTISVANLKATLRDMLNRIIIRYAPQDSIQ